MAEEKQKIPLDTTLIVAEKIKKELELYCEPNRCKIVGSTHRERTEVGDIEFVVIPTMDKECRELFGEEADERCFGFLRACSQIGKRKSGSLVDGKQIVYIHRYQHPTKLLNWTYSIQVEIYVASKNNFGYIQMLRTGSRDYCKRMFEFEIKKNGYYCKDGYIYRQVDDIQVPVPEEKDMWPLLGLDPILPQYRI